MWTTRKHDTTSQRAARDAEAARVRYPKARPWNLPRAGAAQRIRMATTFPPIPVSSTHRLLQRHTVATGRWPLAHWLVILGLWAAIFAASLASPPLLDDADATHAQAAQAMLTTGDLVTLHVDGIRYLEKAPLPYWLAALSLRAFTSPATLATRAAFAVHLPLAFTVLGLALLGYAWMQRAFGERAALYAAVFTLTAAGVFLFTRVFIPDALLSLLLAAALYAFLQALEIGASRHHARLVWVLLALAVLTKGLVALVLFLGTAMVFLALSGEFGRWRQLAPISGPLLFLAIAAPWHILAGLRNSAGAGGHGFYWFYFINEHVLRFLGERIPRDYNKLPAALYWSLHGVWLFPWSLFAPAAIVVGVRERRRLRARSFASRTVLLLGIFSALVLVFFSLSTNQEYYTFPVYLPLLMLLAAGLVVAENDPNLRPLRLLLTASYAAFAVIGAAIAVALAGGLWSARRLPYVADIGSLLAHRGVGDYTLSMSHFFDLTGSSFAALRLPTALAAAAFAIGPAVAWRLHARRRRQAAVMSVAATSAVFLIAAHIALVRFAPMLSSQGMAATIQSLEAEHRVPADSEVLLYGDQAFGSSIPFYLHRQVLLVDGRSTSMLFGSTFADAPPIFITPAQLAAQWGTGPRKLLFVPLEQRGVVDPLLGSRAIVLQEFSGKALLTDRPLESSGRSAWTLADGEPTMKGANR
jgi:4-amino-4-deoxy-L-arabinose transferase-like glycosyltransferase